ncbi:hypothetical protein [Candidatus Rhodobacter oscarellae]|nr:hypothetical protein [Candidatus Rhodobacter lobularis]
MDRSETPMRLAYGFCLALCPSLALACPTAADLDAGILLTAKTGDTETFTRFSEDVVQSIYSDGDGFQNRALLGQGVYLLELMDLEDGKLVPDTRITYAFPVVPGELPEPVAGGLYSAEIAVQDAGDVQREAQRYEFSEITQATYADCTYDLIKVAVSYGDSDNTIDRVHYFPTLGISYLAGSSYGIGADRKEDLYEYVAIKALAPAAAKGDVGKTDASGN